MLWELHGFLLHSKYLKTFNFQMLVFSHIFPYYGNLLFPCFGNCFGFTWKKSFPIHEWERFPSMFHELRKKYSHISSKPTAWEWYGFPQNISMPWEFVHSLKMGLHEFSLTQHLWGRAEPGNCLCFPILAPQYGNLLIPRFRNCIDFCFTWNM